MPGVGKETYRPKRISQLSVSKTNLLLIIFAAIVLGFFAGAYKQQIYSAVAPALNINVSDKKLDVDDLQLAYRKLVTNYDGEINKEKLSEGAIRGMVAAVGDEYTQFFNSKEAEKFDNDLSGSIGGGIGAQIGLINDQVSVVMVLPGTPAEVGGLKPADKIVKINDESVKGYSVDEAVKKIRGEIGTTIKLEVLRGEDKKQFSFTRADIKAPSVLSDIKQGVGVMTVVRFDSTTVNEARKATSDFKKQNVKGVILDLRGNPGGYITAAQGLAGLWLDDKLVVTEKAGNKVIDELYSNSSSEFSGMPTVVLVDGNSASASEIVAGALQDYKVAKIVGEPTFGKGSVQRILPLANGAALKVTIARWFTPNGSNISKEGVKPDLKIKLDEAKLRDGEDTQLNKAFELLR